MDQLPVEVAHRIFQSCDISSLLALRQVNYGCYLVVHHILSKQTSFDFVKDDGKIVSECQKAGMKSTCQMHGMVEFIRNYMSTLQQIRIGSAPFRITLTNLIQLAEAAPQLTSLEVCQSTGLPEVEQDSLYALPYFKHLKSLSLQGWNTVEGVRRGCAHRAETIPLRYLHRLECLSIECSNETIVKLLVQMHKERVVLRKLTAVNFAVRFSDVQLPFLLNWFLNSHDSLEHLSLRGFMFATEVQVEHFYRNLCSLRNLKSVRLEECTAVSALSRDIELECRQSLASRGCVLDGAVKSMRFAP